jgi:protein-S-isoprenylcysteine O-methyltransferase Ste14
MKTLYIPPMLMLYSVIAMAFLYTFASEFNLLPFPYNLIGLVIAFAGFVLMGKARDQFKKYNTTLKVERSSHLITDGVFSKTRNPMYLGMSVLILGFAILSTNVLSIVVPIIFLILVSVIFIKQEEALMHQAFGQEYLKYKKEVRRWI